MPEKLRLFKYCVIWTVIGFLAGCMLYLILYNVFHLNISFGMTTFLAATYSGFFIGGLGGFFYICRNG